MVNTFDIRSYFQKKICLLKQCLYLSEEILSNAKDLEQLSSLIEKRLSVIYELQALDENADNIAIESCSKSQLSQIDSLVKLITSIDRDVVNLIKQEQKKVVESMKNNTKGQKVARYQQKSLVFLSVR